MANMLSSDEIMGSSPVVLWWSSDGKEDGQGADHLNHDLPLPWAPLISSSLPNAFLSEGWAGAPHGIFTRRPGSVFSELTAESVSALVKEGTWGQLMNKNPEHSISDMYFISWQRTDSKVKQNPKCITSWCQRPRASYLTSLCPRCHICKMW